MRDERSSFFLNKCRYFVKSRSSFLWPLHLFGGSNHFAGTVGSSEAFGDQHGQLDAVGSKQHWQQYDAGAADEDAAVVGSPDPITAGPT